MVSDEDLPVVEQHAVDGLDGSIGSLGGLVVDETVTSGSSSVVDGDLAGEDVSEGGEGVVESLKKERGSRVSEEEREDGTSSSRGYIPCCQFPRRGS